MATLQEGTILQATAIRYRHTEGPSLETNLPDQIHVLICMRVSQEGRVGWDYPVISWKIHHQSSHQHKSPRHHRSPRHQPPCHRVRSSRHHQLATNRRLRVVMSWWWRHSLTWWRGNL